MNLENSKVGYRISTTNRIESSIRMSPKNKRKQNMIPDRERLEEKTSQQQQQQQQQYVV